jgi:hypothetical protein
VPSCCVGKGSELGCRWVQGEQARHDKDGCGQCRVGEGWCAMQADILRERIDWRGKRNNSWARIFLYIMSIQGESGFKHKEATCLVLTNLTKDRP